MLVLYLIIVFLSFKCLPILKNKVNYEYEKKFNIIIFSRENSKKPLIAAMLILFGKIQKNSNDKILGIILVLLGIGIMLYVIYDIYKKTNFLFGTIAAGIYLFIFGLQFLFGVMMFILTVGALIVLAMGNNTNYPGY